LIGQIRKRFHGKVQLGVDGLRLSCSQKKMTASASALHPAKKSLRFLDRPGWALATFFHLRPSLRILAFIDRRFNPA